MFFKGQSFDLPSIIWIHHDQIFPFKFSLLEVGLTLMPKTASILCKSKGLRVIPLCTFWQKYEDLSYKSKKRHMQLMLLLLKQSQDWFLWIWDIKFLSNHCNSSFLHPHHWSRQLNFHILCEKCHKEKGNTLPFRLENMQDPTPSKKAQFLKLIRIRIEFDHLEFKTYAFTLKIRGKAFLFVQSKSNQTSIVFHMFLIR